MQHPNVYEEETTEVNYKTKDWKEIYISGQNVSCKKKKNRAWENNISPDIRFSLNEGMVSENYIKLGGNCLKFQVLAAIIIGITVMKG